MRLLFVGTLNQPGGAASHFVTLATAMAAAGHQVAAVAFRDGIIWHALERHGRVALHAGNFQRRFSWRALSAVKEAIRRERPDWIIGSFERDYWGTALVSASEKVPLALFLHHAGLRFSSRHGLPRLVRRFLLPSEALQHWIVSKGVPRDHTHVLYNPIDTQHFKPDAALRARQRDALGLASDDVLVGYVGRLEADKGVVPFAESLTSAMARVPSLRALWIGFGRREADVDRVIHDSPFASRHFRRPWTDDVLPYYAAMDILALPSAGPESFGRVLVEAQACGVPVLGSNIGGIGEAMNAGTTGRLVAPTDVNAWTAALCELATDSALRCCMGAAGPAFVRERFDSARIVVDFERVLASAQVA